MLVTLKLATSLDGKIAMASGESQWITGQEARSQGHALRATHDAVLVGSETVLADDPLLTVRNEGFEGRQPVRVILDGRLRLPLDSQLVRTALDTPTWVITHQASNKRLTDAGVKLISLPGKETRLSILAVIDTLSKLGIASLMVEGGGRVAGAFLAAGCVDRLEWFRAPMILGGNARNGIADLGFATLAETPRFKRTALVPLGQDIWERYEKV